MGSAAAVGAAASPPLEVVAVTSGEGVPPFAAGGTAGESNGLSDDGVAATAYRSSLGGAEASLADGTIGPVAVSGGVGVVATSAPIVDAGSSAAAFDFTSVAASPPCPPFSGGLAVVAAACTAGGLGVPLYSIFSQQPAHVASSHNVAILAGIAKRLDACIDLLY